MTVREKALDLAEKHGLEEATKIAERKVTEAYSMGEADHWDAIHLELLAIAWAAYVD